MTIKYNKDDKVFDVFGDNVFKDLYLYSIDISIYQLKDLEDAGIIKILDKNVLDDLL